MIKKLFTLIISIIIPFIVNAQWEQFNSSNTPEIPSDNFKAGTVAPDGTLFFATDNGLVSFDGSNWESYNASEDNIISNSILDLIIDGNSDIPKLWMGTEEGVSMGSIEAGNFTLNQNYNSVNSELYDEYIYSVGMTMDMVLIFGTGSNVNTFVSNEWSGIKNFNTEDSLALDNSPVFDIVSRDDKTYLGANGDGVFVCDNETDGISVSTVWIAPYNVPPPVCEDLGGGNYNTNITSICLEEDGDQWIATEQGVVLHEGSVSQSGWDLYFNEESGLPNSHVNKVFVDSYGVVWLGTNGGIVKIVNKVITESYNSTDGLASDIVNDIIEDKQGMLWFLTDNGISRFTTNSIDDINTTENDPVLSIYPNPVYDYANISFSVSSPGPVRISLYDMNGTLISVLNDHYFNEGTNEFECNLLNITNQSGIYFLQIEGENLLARQKFVMIR